MFAPQRSIILIRTHRKYQRIRVPGGYMTYDMYIRYVCTEYNICTTAAVEYGIALEENTPHGMYQI